MTPIANEHLDSLLKCTPEERAEAAVRLIESLDRLDSPPEECWAEIAERRWKEIESGQVTCRSVEEVLDELESSLDT